MAKKPVVDTSETAVKTITLELPVHIANYLSGLINAAQLSGNAGQLRQLLTAHEELVARFNEAMNR